ncbi:MAG: SDR family oxidoreductase [Proteobacteria bacterium]|jgi:NAD(P)-dependent dehydrogenase (short-subunit alcohol dehydrogenase family)|nr:SDR family oxidoreductase [Pseudomonadota bacterium]MBK7116016.1 SDR family oxidoreductase [Pseudomonadota bacterium]
MQRVLVTAGANGIGLAIARAFHASGARVYVCDIDAAALERAAAALPGVIVRRCNIGDRADTSAMVADCIGRLGGIDVLVNNAGIGGPTAPVHEMNPADWDAVLRVNLTGAFDVSRAVIPELIRAGRGVIINMASAAGRFGYANRSAYAASKWALIGLTKTLSMELGPHHIRVNAIAPGAVQGERVDRVFTGRAQLSGRSVEEERRLGLANQSIPQFVDPADIAQLAVFLASDAARSISGQVLPIDGDMQRA